MIYQDMKIQVHYRRMGEAIRSNKAARAFLKTLGYEEEEFFAVQVVESRRGEMPEPEIIPYTQARKDALEPLLVRLEKERKKMTLEEVAQLGTVLADLLFYGTVRDLLVRCIDYAEDQGEGLRLRLILKDSQTSRLPWEYVYRQRVASEKATWSGFLALDPNISIVRHVPMLVPSRSITTHRPPLKVFCAFAEPTGIGEDLDQETVRLDIEKALHDQIEKGQIYLTIDEQLQVKNLDKVRGYGIFSFSGHGAYFTADELADYREKYRVKEDDGAEPEATTEPEAAAEPEETTIRKADRATLRAGFGRRQPETVRYQADRDTLRTGFAQRQANRSLAEEQAETTATTETEQDALHSADRATLRAGFARREDRTALRKADRNTLVAGFARRQKQPATVTRQPYTEAKTGARQIALFQKRAKFDRPFSPSKDVFRSSVTSLFRRFVQFVVRPTKTEAKTEAKTETTEESSQGILVLERGQERHPHFYPADNLAQRLKRAGVSVVVMDACYSAKYTNEYDKWTGISSALVRVGIPAVIGMQYAFSDPAAKAFWPDFYEAVAAGLPLDEAVLAGRLAIMDLEPEPSEDNPDQMLTGQNDFGFPALYMRSDDGILFPEDPASEVKH